MKKRASDPVSEIVKLLDRVVTLAGLTQFQIMTISRRLDALEKTAAAQRRQGKLKVRR